MNTRQTLVQKSLFHQDDPSNRVPTYAVLDGQSTDFFITNALLNQLQTEGQDVNLEINTILGTNTVRTKNVNGLRIQDIEGQHQPMKIPLAYSREAIPANQSEIATPETASNWEHREKHKPTPTLSARHRNWNANWSKCSNCLPTPSHHLWERRRTVD